MTGRQRVSFLLGKTPPWLILGGILGAIAGPFGVYHEAFEANNTLAAVFSFVAFQWVSKGIAWLILMGIVFGLISTIIGAIVILVWIGPFATYFFAMLAFQSLWPYINGVLVGAICGAVIIGIVGFLIEAVRRDSAPA